MHNAGGELPRILIPRTSVNKGKKRKGGGLASPITSAQALFLAVHSPTRLAVTCSSIDAPTNSGSVRTNAN
jgi:hypothetical protein